jgi:hypothetical protein
MLTPIETHRGLEADLAVEAFELDRLQRCSCSGGFASSRMFVSPGWCDGRVVVEPLRSPKAASPHRAESLWPPIACRIVFEWVRKGIEDGATVSLGRWQPFDVTFRRPPLSL